MPIAFIVQLRERESEDVKDTHEAMALKMARWDLHRLREPAKGSGNQKRERCGLHLTALLMPWGLEPPSAPPLERTRCMHCKITLPRGSDRRIEVEESPFQIQNRDSQSEKVTIDSVFCPLTFFSCAANSLVSHRPSRRLSAREILAPHRVRQVAFAISHRARI